MKGFLGRLAQNWWLVLAMIAITSAPALTGCDRSAPAGLKDPSMTPGSPIPADKMLTQDDLLYADIPVGLQMSPDGNRAMWVVGNYIQGQELPAFRIFVADLDTLSSTEIASIPGIFSAAPEWAPDGSKIAYGAYSDDGTPQIFTVAVAEAEPVQVTEEAWGMLGFSWRSANTIVFTEPVPGAESKTAQETGDDTIHVSDTTDDAVRLFQADLVSGEVKPVTSNSDQITYFTVSPDGGKAFVTRTNAAGGADEYYQEIPALNFLLDLDTGQERQVLDDVRRVTGTMWSADSQTLYVQYSSSPDKIIAALTTMVKALNTGTNSETDVDLDWDRGIHSQTSGASPMKPVSDGFFALLADGANPKLARYTVSDSTISKEVLDGNHQGNIFSFDVSRDGRSIVYLYSTPSIPPQIYTADIQGTSIVNPRQMTDFNPGWVSKQYTRSETITWEGALGEPVEGVLIYPAGYQPGKRYPLMLMIHGGPTNLDLDEWASRIYTVYPYQMVAQEGAFVLAANYHGSTEYGLEFARSIRNGKFLEYPLQDLENGVQRLVDLGMVDGERLATLGWSNGGVLSYALIARDQRFKAASIGAGASEFVSLWGQSAFGDAFLEYYFGASPLENPAMYQDPDMAPLYDAGNVKTPVVIYQGTEDRYVPLASAWIAYRALQKYSQAPVQLFLFPGEAHDPFTLSHQKRKLAEDMKLFDRYFFEQ